MVAPPPIVEKKSNKLVIWLIVVGFLGTCLVCGFGSYGLYRLWGIQPKPMNGHGQVSVAKQLQGGWAVYSFPQVPLTVELPSQPEPSTFEWYPGSALSYAGWTYYQWTSEVAGYTMNGYQYRSRSMADAKEDIYMMIADIRKNEYEDFEGAAEVRQVGSLGGYELRGTYTDEGKKAELIVFLFSQGRSVFHFRTDYWEEHAAQAEPEFERILKSIQMLDR